MFRIYGQHTPMFLKTVIAAEEIGCPYEVIAVDLTKGETRSPENVRRHPFGKVPVLEHNGRFVFESNAIMKYMAGVAESPLYPKDLHERAVVDQWTDYFSLQAGRWCTAVWFTVCIGPKLFNSPADDTFVKTQTEYLLGVMPVIDSHLAATEFLAGKAVSLADVNAYATMRGYRRAGLSLSDFRNFERWFAAMTDRPSVQRAEVVWG